MVRLQTLDLRIGVRVPASQPFPTVERHFDRGEDGHDAQARVLFFVVAGHKYKSVGPAQIRHQRGHQSCLSVHLYKCA
jgi:hypothetical protein